MEKTAQKPRVLISGKALIENFTTDELLTALQLGKQDFELKLLVPRDNETSAYITVFVSKIARDLDVEKKTRLETLGEISQLLGQEDVASVAKVVIELKKFVLTNSWYLIGKTVGRAHTNITICFLPNIVTLYGLGK